MAMFSSNFGKYCTSGSCAGVWVSAWLTILTVLAPQPARADAYLDALNSAASGVEVDPVGEGDTVSPNSEGAVAGVSEDMPKGLSREGFEAYLQKSFFGSFAFYGKLNEAGKQKVFEAYGSRANIDYVRESIKRQYLNR